MSKICCFALFMFNTFWISNKYLNHYSINIDIYQACHNVKYYFLLSPKWTLQKWKFVHINIVICSCWKVLHKHAHTLESSEEYERWSCSFASCRESHLCPVLDDIKPFLALSPTSPPSIFCTWKNANVDQILTNKLYLTTCLN